MPSKLELADRICNQMLKGPSGKMPDISEEQKAAFFARYGELSKSVAEATPYYSGDTVSPAFGAVICKCIIRYGKYKTMQLIDRISQGTFQGQNDPAKLLFVFMTSSKGLTTQQIYQKVVSAARAFCEDRTLHELRYASTDIFEWNSDFSSPAKSLVVDWWKNEKPIYTNGGSFRVFARKVNDCWEYVINRKAEIIQMCEDQVQVANRPPRKNDSTK
jgi:hypothetical protein